MHGGCTVGAWNMEGGGACDCVCELDTAHIHVMATSNHVLELAIGNMHLLSRAVQACFDVSDIQPPDISGWCGGCG